MQVVSRMPEVFPNHLPPALPVPFRRREGRAPATSIWNSAWVKTHTPGTPKEYGLVLGNGLGSIMWCDEECFSKDLWLAVPEKGKQGWMGPRAKAERIFNTQPEEIYEKDTMIKGWERLPFTLRGQHVRSLLLYNLCNVMFPRRVRPNILVDSVKWESLSIRFFTFWLMW